MSYEDFYKEFGFDRSVYEDKTLYQGKTRTQWLRDTKIMTDNPISIKFFEECGKIQKPFKNYGIEKNGNYYPIDNRTYVSHSTYDGIEPLVKHLDFYFANFADNLSKKHTRKDFINFALDLNKFMGEIDFYFILSKIMHLRNACQFQIQKEVSRDALFCDSSQITSVSDIPWFHHKVIEFFFEDSDLPTFLVYRGSFDGLVDEFNIPHKVVGKQEEGIHFFAETPTLGSVLFSVDNETLPLLFSRNYNELLSVVNSDTTSKLTLNSKEGAELTKEEIPHLVSGVVTCLKSMVYAHCDPTHIRHNVPQSTLKDGKAKIKGRPKSEVNKIIYVPKVQYENSASSNNTSKEKRKFLGKLPYFRIYKNDRYVNMEKDKKYFYPKVLGENGEDPVEREYTKYIARKINTPFK